MTAGRTSRRLLVKNPSTYVVNHPSHPLSPSTSDSDAVEPVSLSAVVVDGGVTLLWTVAGENPGHPLAVQRSTEEGDFRSLGCGRTHADGERAGCRAYTFRDDHLPYAASQFTYRLVSHPYRDCKPDGTEDIHSTAAISQVVVEPPPPDAVELLPTFPEPATVSITLRYGLPADGPVCLEVTSGAGRTITVVAGDRQAGRYQENVDVSGLAAGSGNVRLTAGDAEASASLTIRRRGTMDRLGASVLNRAT